MSRDVARPDVAETIRPWGRFRQYAHDEPVTVSLMHVLPGQRLSLQAHRGRAELWIVLDEGALVTVGERTWRPQPNEELWIGVAERHRLAHGGTHDRPIRVLEVAFGTWRQDDIERFDDDYARPEKGE
jgi:mannose-6-phosphate isomerase